MALVYSVSLTPPQQATWEPGGWDAHRVEMDILEDIDQLGLVGLTIVTQCDGTYAFSVSSPWAACDQPREVTHGR